MLELVGMLAIILYQMRFSITVDKGSLATECMEGWEYNIS